MTTQNTSDVRFALVTKQQLEEWAQVDRSEDWATLGQRRVQPKGVDVFTTGIGGGYEPPPCLSHAHLAG